MAFCSTRYEGLRKLNICETKNCEIKVCELDLKKEKKLWKDRKWADFYCISLWIIFYFGLNRTWAIKANLIKLYTNLILRKSKQEHPLSHQQLVIKLWNLKNAKYQFWGVDAEFKIPNVRCKGLFSQSVVYKTEGL